MRGSVDERVRVHYGVRVISTCAGATWSDLIGSWTCSSETTLAPGTRENCNYGSGSDCLGREHYGNERKAKGQGERKLSI